MSALPPKADIADAMKNVRFVPKADIGGVSGMSAMGQTATSGRSMS
jgi:hypothetical protein